MTIVENGYPLGLYLYGASGHALVIRDIFWSDGHSDKQVVAFIDDFNEAEEIYGLPIFRYSDFVKIRERFELENNLTHSSIIIAIGDNRTRKRIAEDVLGNVRYDRAISGSAIVSKTAQIGMGSVVMQGAIIQTKARISKHCIINTGASVDHECVISDFCHVSPHATLCGNVALGEGVWIGAGATVIPGVSIGAWSVVGAGALVTKDVPENTVVVGVPARKILTIPQHKKRGT